MRSIYLVPLLVVGLALAACAEKSYPPVSGSSSAAPTASAALPPPDVAPAAGHSAATQGTAQDDGWVSSYPYGTASEATGATVSPGGETPVAATVDQTDSDGSISVLSSQEADSSVQSAASGWQNPSTTPEQHQADIEACYRYAWSQVQHDMQIEDDVSAARTDGDDGLGFTQLTKRMNLYDHRNRRTTLINNCMESKGYIQS